MANNRFNKQVTPKGYKMGGRVKKMGGGMMMMKKPMMKKGGSVKKDYKIGTKFQGDYKGKSVPGKVKEFVKTGVKQTIGTAKKIGEKLRTKKMGGGMMMMKRPMMKEGSKLKSLPKGLRKDTTTSAYGDAGKGRPVPIFKRVPKKPQPVRRKKMMGGSSLKPVDPKTQKGLSKLPTKVRNKMGFMKKGGKVK
jgi:hypothetical protein